MAMIVESLGWRDEGEGEKPTFQIVLTCDNADDVPKLPVSVVWDKSPVFISWAGNDDCETAI